jgi:hypothetical protein
VGRATVFRFISTFIKGGVEALLKREHKGGCSATLKADDQEAFLNELRAGRFRRAKEARTWIEKLGRFLSSRQAGWHWRSTAVFSVESIRRARCGCAVRMGEKFGFRRTTSIACAKYAE